MTAFRRAERLERAALDAGEEGRNPTTEVYRLTDAIDDSGHRRRMPRTPEDSRMKAEAAAATAYAQAKQEGEALGPEAEK
jgi:hypothetical protein